MVEAPVGPTGLPKAHVGETVRTLVRVTSLDDYDDTITITNLFRIEHHGTGNVITANLRVPSATLMFYGSYFTIAHFSTVLPGDGDTLTFESFATGMDNNDSVGGGLPLPVQLYSASQLRIVRPCLKVTQSFTVTNSLVTYTGTVVNLGNCTLTNVVATHDRGTPTNRLRITATSSPNDNWATEPVFTLEPVMHFEQAGVQKIKLYDQGS